MKIKNLSLIAASILIWLVACKRDDMPPEDVSTMEETDETGQSLSDVSIETKVPRFMYQDQSAFVVLSGGLVDWNSCPLSETVVRSTIESGVVLNLVASNNLPTVGRDRVYAVELTQLNSDFLLEIHGLVPNSEYYIRAFVREGEEVVYGNEIKVLTPELEMECQLSTQIKTRTFAHGPLTRRSDFFYDNNNNLIREEIAPSTRSGTATDSAFFSGLYEYREDSIFVFERNCRDCNVFGGDLLAVRTDEVLSLFSDVYGGTTTIFNETENNQIVASYDSRVLPDRQDPTRIDSMVLNLNADHNIESAFGYRRTESGYSMTVEILFSYFDVKNPFYRHTSLLSILADRKLRTFDFFAYSYFNKNVNNEARIRFPELEDTDFRTVHLSDLAESSLTSGFMTRNKNSYLDETYLYNSVCL